MVEARQGEEFKVRFRKVPMAENGNISVDIFVDGDHADSECQCNGSKPFTYKQDFRGFIIQKKFRKRIGVVCKAFTFAKMKVTSKFFSVVSPY